MRILLTNDDGVEAPGLKVLLDIAKQLSDDIWIVAPAGEQSGAGHSITISRPLRVKKYGDKHFAVDGTPTDAVMMAVANLMKDSPPDIILSGVNRGANLGEDITYSGTVSAAMEGALAGIPAIALSQCHMKSDEGPNTSFDVAKIWGAKVLKPIISMVMQPRTLVNINFPAMAADQVKGVKVVKQGFRDYGRMKIEEKRDPRGFRYYWFGLGPMLETPDNGTDLEATADGYISVTPLHLDMTDYAAMDALRGKLDGA